MKESSPGADMSLFIQSLKDQAQGREMKTIDLAEAGETHGLVMLPPGLSSSRAACLLRNAAISLSENGREATPPMMTAHSCQVSVEERSQLFSIFRKGAGPS